MHFLQGAALTPKEKTSTTSAQPLPSKHSGAMYANVPANSLQDVSKPLESTTAIIQVPMKASMTHACMTGPRWLPHTSAENEAETKTLSLCPEDDSPSIVSAPISISLYPSCTPDSSRHRASRCSRACRELA